MILLDLPLAWPFLCLALVGFGAAFRRGCGCTDRSLDAFPRDGWVGWGIVLGFLQIWNLFLPIGNWLLGGVIVLGLGLLPWVRPRRIGWTVVILLVPAVWLASHWTLRSVAIDTGLYHLGSIRWAKEFAVVPGLGLLHDRFGFNNGSFLWAALCRHWPWEPHRAASGVEILFFFSLANALLGIRRVMTATNSRPRDLFDALSLVPLLVVIMEDDRYDGPLSPDLLLFPLGLMIFSGLLGYLEDPSEPRAIVLMLLSACAVAVKLSFAGATLVLWALLLVWAHGSRRVMGAAAAVFVGIGGIWSLRSVMLTGWPAFPLPLGGVPVSWLIPAEEVAATGNAIRTWAWAPEGVSFQFDMWLASMANQKFSLVTPLWVCAVAMGIALYRRPRTRAGWALIPAAAGVGVWLATAPLPRFAVSLPWALALVALAWALHGISSARRRWVVPVLTVLLAVHLVDPWAYRAQVRNGPPSIPFVEMDVGFTDSGLAVLVPVEGNQCWDAALPHAPILDPRLRLRIPGDLGAGFRREQPETGSGASASSAFFASFTRGRQATENVEHGPGDGRLDAGLLVDAGVDHADAADIGFIR